MTTNKYLELIDAAKCLASVRDIIEICASHNECMTCPFSMSKRKWNNCIFGNDDGVGVPFEWDIPVINKYETSN